MLVIYLKKMEVENLLKCYMELEIELRVNFLHINSRWLGIYFKIMEAENLLRCHTYEAKEVSHLLQDLED